MALYVWHVAFKLLLGTNFVVPVLRSAVVRSYDQLASEDESRQCAHYDFSQFCTFHLNLLNCSQVFDSGKQCWH